VSGQLHATAALPPGKGPRYPFYRRLGGPQSWSGRYGEVNIFYLIGTRTPAPPGRPASSQSLYRLSYPGSSIINKYCIKGHRHTVCASSAIGTMRVCSGHYTRPTGIICYTYNVQAIFRVHPCTVQHMNVKCCNTVLNAGPYVVVVGHCSLVHSLYISPQKKIT
jgi:hypothetical protein